jgi:nicotinamidase-related amidase
MKPALLVIDVQKQFFADQTQTASLNSAIQYIVPAISMFHDKRLPVVFIQHMEEEDHLLPGTEGFELPDVFDVQPGDIRITKTYGNAFNKTGLEEKLRSLGVDTLILTGFCAEWCVLSTERGARDLDFQPILLLGSLASPSEENIRFVERITDSISFDALKAFLS